MRILRLRAYYFPEQVASSHLLNDMDAEYRKQGVEQLILTPMPTRGIDEEQRKEYKKKRVEVSNDGLITVHRFPMFREASNPVLRMCRYLLCNVIEYGKGIQSKNIDLVYAASTPPTQGLLSGLVAGKLSKKYGHKVPFVYNLQDIFPDSLVNAGMARKGGMIWRIGRRIEDATYKKADKIIVISEGFKRNIMAKGVPEEKIVVVPNWVDTEKIRPVPRAENPLFERLGLDRSRFYICYSGNIGHSQNIPLLLDAAKQLETEAADLRFVIIGEGAEKAFLKDQIEKKQIQNMILAPFQPAEDLAYVFSLGDAGLVISKPGIGASSVPSKTWSIMAAGKPVIASFDEDSELTELLRTEQSGLCSDADDLSGFVANILRMYNDRDTCVAMGERGQRYAKEYLNKQRCIGM